MRHHKSHVDLRHSSLSTNTSPHLSSVRSYILRRGRRTGRTTRPPVVPPRSVPTDTPTGRDPSPLTDRELRLEFELRAPGLEGRRRGSSGESLFFRKSHPACPKKVFLVACGAYGVEGVVRATLQGTQGLRDGEGHSGGREVTTG